MRLTSLYILILLNFAILQGQCTDGINLNLIEFIFNFFLI